jgi:putative transposase
MSRPLRYTAPGTWHHVMNRGRNKQPVYLDDTDREDFLRLVEYEGHRFRLRVACYCLMGNHFHLLVYDEQGHLSRSMQHLGTMYTQTFNKRHERDGALFKGRFRSRVVDVSSYLLEVVRYIHFNPVDAGLVARARDYRWSSHRTYMGEITQVWLRDDLVRPYLGSLTDRAAFDAFVHTRPPENVHKALTASRWKPALGSDEFIDKIRKRIRMEAQFHDEEIREARQQVAMEPKDVIDIAADEFEMSWEEMLRTKRGSLNMHRLLVLLACRELCAETNYQLSHYFGVGAATVPSLVRNAWKVLEDRPEAAEAWARLEKRIAAFHNTQS